jgi:hypothetical protein
MFVIQCDRCGQSNDGTADRCVNCSASFAPPTLRSRAQALVLGAVSCFFLSFFWFLALSDAAGDPRPTSWRNARFFGTLYVLFGIWPPVIVWWIGGGLFLLNARRLRRAATSEAAQSHTVVAASPANASSASAPGNAARVYWSLAGLVAVIAALCMLTTLVGMAPILPPNPFSKRVAYGFSALAGALVIAGVVLMTRVPQRAFTQSTIEYWSLAQVASAATLTWLALESAVTAAGVGYFLTGDPVSTLALCTAIAGFAWCNPSLCAK